MAGITSTKKIKGQPHLLAYITPNEVEKLKALGGQETMTKEGIPAYPEYDNYGYSSAKDFKEGDVSKSNDPNVRGEGEGQNRVTAQQLRQQAIKEDIAKRKLEKSNIGAPKKSVFEKLGAYRTNYNTNYKKKQLARYQKSKIDELNAKLKGLGLNYFGDTEETYGDFIKEYAPSITEFGPEGTGKYSQQFIDDVLSGKRTPPESFSEIDISKVPGGLLTKGLALGANFIGKGMAGPTTYEELMDIYSDNKTGNSYIGARDFDINFSTGKDMMKIFEPNRYQMLYGDNDRGDGQNQQQYIPYLPPSSTDDVAEEEKEFDYRFGTGQKVGRDVTLGYAANGGRITRAGGGIMNAVPRQGFFLGKIAKGIGKAIGSVADAAGKVLKSDVGKMAIAGLGAYYLGGGKNLGGGSFFGNKGFGMENFMGNLGRVGTYIKDNPFKTIGLASVALPFLAGEPKPNEDIGMTNRGGRLLDSQGNEVLPSGIRKEIDEAYASGDAGRIEAIENYYAFLPPRNQYLPYPNYAVGGRVAAQEGGLMNLGGMEKDYRNEGGFVPIGREEKADDVPARLSVNEFVFTADAVRNAGGGDIDKGAEVMENMMKNLENGGTVSEESQGNTGAQEMFSVSERIGEVI